MARQPCLPIDDSTGYLKEKQLDSSLLFKSVGLQSARDSWYGPCLQYPLINVHGEITGYERIFPRGLLHKRSPDRFSKQDNKKVTRGTRVSHSFALLGITLSQLPNYFGTVRIVGGLADAANVYLATKEPVVAIVGEHNAKAVVEQLVNQWPHLNRHIIVALDHDLPGIAACHRSGCVWKVPDQFGEDWSDLAQRAGLDAVRRQLQTVRKPIQPVTLSTIPKPAVDMTIDACCNDYRKSLKALSLCKNELTAATLAKVIILRFYRRVPASLSEQAFLQAIVMANPYFLHPETVQQLKRLLHSYCARQQQVMDREAGLSQMMKTTLGDQYQPINTLRKETVPVEKGQITLIKAPYAAGKTKLLAALSQTALQKDEKVLAITHLVSLAHELSRRLQLNSYLDMPAAFMTGINRLVTCINSLCSPALSQFLAMGKPDVLILDEFSQHISVLATSPHIKDPSILSRYLDLIEQTSTVVICDADLSSYHIRLLQEWFPDRKVQCYDMPFPEHSDRSCHFSTGKQCAHAVVEQKLLPALARGERVAIATDSRCHACKLDEIVQKRLPHIPRLLIHGKNRTEQEQAAFLQDNRKVVHRYQLIIYTPAIQSGLSIDAPVDQVFGFSHNVILPTDFVQMLRRCRTTNTFNLVADLMPGKRGNEDWLARLQALQHAQRYNSNCDGVAIQEYDGFCERERSRHIRLRSLAANGLFYLMQSRGFTMHYDQSLTHSQAFKALWQEAEETVERKELKAVFTAPALSQPQFEQLNQKVDPSQQEQYSCERYRISEELGITANELQERDIRFWKNTGLTRLRRFMQFPLEKWSPLPVLSPMPEQRPFASVVLNRLVWTFIETYSHHCFPTGITARAGVKWKQKRCWIELSTGKTNTRLCSTSCG